MCFSSGASIARRAWTRARPPAMSTALGSTPGGDHEDARFEAELSSRYEDDDDDATETTPPAAAAGAENAPDALRGAAVAGPAEDDGPGERGWADRMDEFPDDDGEEDAPYDAYDEEDGYDDDDIAAALESLDTRRTTSRREAVTPAGAAASPPRRGARTPTAAPGTTVKIVSRPLRA